MDGDLSVHIPVAPGDQRSLFVAMSRQMQPSPAE